MAKGKRTTRQPRKVNGSELKLLTLESGIPLPARGERDPEFKNLVRDLLKTMKKGQSFVVPKQKIHLIKKMTSSEFENYKIRTSVITPDKKFGRIWRLA
jgi:hypothetical protein